MTRSAHARWPAHAYVPGRSERHPDDAFDELKATVRPGAAADELAACEAFRTGLRWLDAGYGWEAHELLEPIWMALPDDGAERRFVQALIQLANGRLKLAMERPKAARRLADLARGLLPADAPARILGVAVRDVRLGIDALEASCPSLE